MGSTASTFCNISINILLILLLLLLLLNESILKTFRTCTVNFSYRISFGVIQQTLCNRHYCPCILMYIILFPFLLTTNWLEQVLIIFFFQYNNIQYYCYIFPWALRLEYLLSGWRNIILIVLQTTCSMGSWIHILIDTERFNSVF